MSEQFIGYSVSIEVGGGLGFYQGYVKNVNTNNQHITLTKVLHNGKPTNKPEVTINAADILELRILNRTEESSFDKLFQNSKYDITENESLLVSIHENINSDESQLTKKKMCVDSSFRTRDEIESAPPLSKNFACIGTKINPLVNQIENLSLKESNHPSGSMIKRKTRTSVGEILAGGSHSNECRNGKKTSFTAGSAPPYEYGYQRKSVDLQQGKRQWNKLRQNLRDESTFGTPIDDNLLNTEFDFEKNLALFDKQAVLEEIQNLKPDVVRQADKKIEKKYRCDENIVVDKPKPKRQIVVPGSEAGEIIYATDNGLLVPSISAQLRLNLLSTANQFGLTKSRQLEMIGRGATEIIISVIGGSHRLEPGNSHQAPVVVLLCGVNIQGAAGVNCGRQLESQGVQTVVVTPPLPSLPSTSLLFSHEVQLYNMTSGAVKTNVTAMPSTVDLIVDARFDLLGNLGLNNQCWINDTNAWASGSRAPILSLDPPSDLSLPYTPRIRLCPTLPLAYTSEKGKVYLLNLNIPQQVFTSLDIKYTSPFGAKMVIPLHPCE
ncbi:UNVERIFIED_CONTAM: hypothetical protein RMT77_007012 [Armadillidium vulgare]